MEPQLVPDTSSTPFTPIIVDKKKWETGIELPAIAEAGSITYEGFELDDTKDPEPEEFYQSASRGKGLTIRGTSDKKRIVFTISTRDLDRHNTVIETAGIDLDHFRANPVVLFDHGYDFTLGNTPIGRAVNITLKENGDLMAEVEFDSKDPRAAEIERKVRDKFINAASIGFRVLEREWRGHHDDEDKQLVYTKTELFEFSIVAVPSNPKALVAERNLQAAQANQPGPEYLETLKRVNDFLDTAEASAEESVDQGAQASEPTATIVPTPTVKERQATPAEVAKYAAELVRQLGPIVKDELKKILGKK